MSELIAALATPTGRSALAIVRLSGTGSAGLMEELMHLEKGRLAGMRRVLGKLYNGETVLDNVVALSWPEGRSYTGEQMVELICHGVPSIARSILALLLRSGSREAEPGEFTRRAFISGTMNGFDVMALAVLWEKGSAGIAGAFREKAELVLKALEEAEEALEGRIEFEESHGTDSTKQAVGKLMRTACRAVEEMQVMACTLDGRSRIFIMGPRNSGKSTLLNVLTGREYAVVSALPGTTRDGRSAEIEINGRSIMIYDTAGAGGEGLDKQAEMIARSEISDPDRVVWMSEGEGCEPDGKVVDKALAVLVVQAKADLHDRKGFRISSVTGEGMEELRKWIASSQGDISLTGVSRAISELLQSSFEHMKENDEALASDVLKQASTRIRALLNEESMELMVERALSRLCVGK